MTADDTRDALREAIARLAVGDPEYPLHRVLAIEATLAAARRDPEPVASAHPDDGHKHSLGCRICGVDAPLAVYLPPAEPVASAAAAWEALVASISHDTRFSPASIWLHVNAHRTAIEAAARRDPEPVADALLHGYTDDFGDEHPLDPEPVASAGAALRALRDMMAVACDCNEAWTGRNRHAPDCRYQFVRDFLSDDDMTAIEAAIRGTEARASLDVDALATAMAGVPLGWLDWVKSGPGDYPERYRKALQNAAGLIAAEYDRVRAILAEADRPKVNYGLDNDS